MRRRSARALHTSLSMRFAIFTALLHAVLVGLTVALWRIHRRRVAASTHPHWRWLARAGTLWLLASVAAAGVATLAYRTETRFTWLRFLAQLAFGELPALGLGLTYTLGRRFGRRVATPPLLAALTLVGIYVRAYHVEPRQLELRQHRLSLGPSERPVRSHLRIAQLSDLQTPDPGEHERRALRAVLAEQPDLILFTGDYVQPRMGVGPESAAALSSFRDLLRREHVTAPLGAFAVPGDTDRDWPLPIADSGVTALSDEVHTLELGDGQRLALVALSLTTSRSRTPERLNGLLAQATHADYRLVFGHRPDFAIPLARRGGADLALAGHTHGGQVALPFFGPLYTSSPLPRRFAGDLHVFEGLPLHVSRGVGMERRTAPQLRFLCPPEVCMIEVDLR